MFLVLFQITVKISRVAVRSAFILQPIGKTLLINLLVANAVRKLIGVIISMTLIIVMTVTHLTRPVRFINVG